MISEQCITLIVYFKTVTKDKCASLYSIMVYIGIDPVFVTFGHITELMAFQTRVKKYGVSEL